MKVYIDFDDVICETARYFVKAAREMFDVDVPYSRVEFFDLQKSFGLNDIQYHELMRVGHLTESLLGYDETDGASEMINKWISAGHEIFVITGRPFSAYEASRKWLDMHRLERASLYCVDKYGRETRSMDCSYNMTLEKLYSMPFDFAVEDSPTAFKHILMFENCRTAVFDRPWNEDAEFPNDSFVRCRDWKAVDMMFDSCSRHGQK